MAARQVLYPGKDKPHPVNSDNYKCSQLLSFYLHHPFDLISEKQMDFERLFRPAPAKGLVDYPLPFMR
jgi:hypothetical protein